MKLARRRFSFYCAFKGLVQMLREEVNARIHLGITLAVLGLAFWLELNRIRWALLIFSIGFVWSAEGFNTAIERLAGLAAPGYSKQAGAVKDLAAGAVLVAAATAFILGILILGPPLYERFFQ